jgi:predicted esterase
VIGTRPTPSVRVVEAVTHGRYLVQPPSIASPRGLVIGCHGYAENAATMLDRLTDIPGSNAWVLASVQGLHRFYRGAGQEIAASWMTREDRELAVGDNVKYLAMVVDALIAEWPACPPLVFAGFSQGVAMAFRAACGIARPVGGVIGLGGDVPPELTTTALRRVTCAFHGRGDRDSWYTIDQFAADQHRLLEAGVDLTTFCLDADHAWTPAFSEAAGHFLQRFESTGR